MYSASALHYEQFGMEQGQMMLSVPHVSSSILQGLPG